MTLDLQRKKFLLVESMATKGGEAEELRQVLKQQPATQNKVTLESERPKCLCMIFLQPERLICNGRGGRGCFSVQPKNLILGATERSPLLGVGSHTGYTCEHEGFVFHHP